MDEMLRGLEGQQIRAATRFRQTAGQREELDQRRRQDGVPVVDTTAQIEARAERLFRSGHVPTGAVLASVKGPDPVARHVLLERIIAETNDLQPVTFLTRGARTIRSIARITLRDRGRQIPFGTGFLVSRRLLLTNHHVLPDPGWASRSVAEFNCEIDPDGEPAAITEYGFDPDTLFLTDDGLDYTLIALHAGQDGEVAGDAFPWNPLIEQQGKIVNGEPLNVVGHPSGRLKEIAIRNGRLDNQVDHFLHYTTDTERGSSGSAVYNDQWEVVALHHASVPDTDAGGNYLKPDGTRWHPDDGDDAIHWVANEGTRVSVLLAHLRDRDMTAARRAVVDELHDDVPLAAASARGTAAGAPARGTAARAPTVGTAAGAPALDTAAGVPAVAVNGTGAAMARASRHPTTTVEARWTGGVPARGPSLAGATHLVFLHGRSQQGRDPGALRAAWAAGLSKGLVLAGSSGINAQRAWFPYYGDALIDALRTRESLPVTAAEALDDPAAAFAPADAAARRRYEALIDDAAAAVGYPTAADGREALGGALIGRLRDRLGWLADRSRLDEMIIASTFRDVAAYLDRDRVRDRVLDTVLETMPTSGRTILVSHSLGTVVAMDLLTRLPDAVDVVKLVTVGSPLGLDSVHSRLLIGGPKVPGRVEAWVNVWCPADPIAIGCPLREDWGDDVSEIITDNPSGRAHDITEYLADPRVARRIGSEL
jgi:endonuclease G